MYLGECGQGGGILPLFNCEKSSNIIIPINTIFWILLFVKKPRREKMETSKIASEFSKLCSDLNREEKERNNHDYRKEKFHLDRYPINKTILEEETWNDIKDTFSINTAEEEI